MHFTLVMLIFKGRKERREGYEVARFEHVNIWRSLEIA